MAHRTKFITFEGGDGTGKSSQINIIKKLKRSDIFCTNPQEVEEARLIRSLLLDHNNKWQKNAEMLLHIAARIEHVEQIIKTKLQEQKHVICDRFIDSTLAYQGYGNLCDRQLIIKLHQILGINLIPDLTFIFDLDPLVSLARREARAGKRDRYEVSALSFHQRVRDGFLQIAQNNKRCVIIDASLTQENIAALIAKTMCDRLGIII